MKFLYVIEGVEPDSQEDGFFFPCASDGGEWNPDGWSSVRERMTNGWLGPRRWGDIKPWSFEMVETPRRPTNGTSQTRA